MSSDSVSIIPQTGDYVRAAGELIVAIQRDEFGFAMSIDNQPDLVDVDGYYRLGKGNFWIALSEGRVIGTIALKDIGNGQGALRKMFVHPDFRGAAAGVAQRLLQVLLDWCQVQGFQTVFLGTTERFQAAHRFYERNGFVPVAQEDLPAAFPLMGVDTRFYVRRLGARSSAQ
ncbi:GNAT family N-acetyltransferase [Tahibacter amnicola]|uniref:GNAT family N-acetyltransferase n=1 Tax=Tahibacter amnicola TaxID=2976241 RepID=A0ABY6BG52_9GAMM|nr:GNAT family N-acetyltransferase [Tahibacter amnicola]UXI68762.1 GNAT family N-acetyltransferase [Tahibacter amnicola]